MYNLFSIACDIFKWPNITAEELEKISCHKIDFENNCLAGFVFEVWDIEFNYNSECFRFPGEPRFGVSFFFVYLPQRLEIVQVNNTLRAVFQQIVRIKWTHGYPEMICQGCSWHGIAWWFSQSVTHSQLSNIVWLGAFFSRLKHRDYFLFLFH